VASPLITAELIAAEPAPPADAVRVRARPLARHRVTWAAWDDFATRCDASFRGSYHHIGVWAAKHWMDHRVALFELLAETGGGARKIGQCAVGLAKDGRSRFLDRLQLVPGSEGLWDLAIAAVLAETGPGAYEYGDEWSVEPARDALLRRLPGVSLQTVRPLVVQAIDFGRWTSWDEYYRGVVGNVRRSANAATRRYPNLVVDVARGRAAMASIPDLVRLRTRVHARKGLGGGSFGFMLSKAVFTISCARHVISGHVRAGGRPMGAFYGAEFGANTYYLDGASARGNTGASWRLLMSMIARAFDRAPDGRFVMGFVDYARHEEAVSGGLLRSRRACRVSDFPTSVVQFRYDG